MCVARVLFIMRIKQDKIPVLVVHREETRIVVRSKFFNPFEPDVYKLLVPRSRFAQLTIIREILRFWFTTGVQHKPARYCNKHRCFPLCISRTYFLLKTPLSIQNNFQEKISIRIQMQNRSDR